MRYTTAKIHYGPPGKSDLYWRVKISNASKSLVLSAKLFHALNGHAGSTIACAISNCAMEHKTLFSHPVHFVAVTKTRILVVDKLKDGAPAHAVRYAHNRPDIVDIQDTKSKRFMKKHAALLEGDVTLSPPPVAKTRAGDGRAKGPYNGRKRAFAHRGALQRAVRAGLISKPVAQAIAA